jgi:hypothetical protein
MALSKKVIKPRPLTRNLNKIAKEIEANWSSINFAAWPYLDAMKKINGGLTEVYGTEPADVIVRYFLANAGTWRGAVANRIKDELRSALLHHDNLGAP